MSKPADSASLLVRANHPLAKALLVEPVLSPIWAWLVHGETPGPLALLGGAVILTATAYKSRADAQVVAA